MRRIWVTISVLAVLIAVAVPCYLAWRQGDNIWIPGIGVVRRFPCGDYSVPPSGYGTTQAFAVIDAAALAARSNKRQAVRTLVDAVFDRELPDVRCGNPLRHRVAEAEWQFRSGNKLPVAEQTLASVANEVLKASEAPSWARTSVEELHLMRMLLREELPRFVGTVDSERKLPEKMSPIEAVFIVMTLGRGMVMEPDEFRGGPEAYVAHLRELQSNPPRPGAVFQVSVQLNIGLVNGGAFDDQPTLAATSAQRFFDGLGFPR